MEARRFCFLYNFCQNGQKYFYVRLFSFSCFYKIRLLSCCGEMIAKVGGFPFYKHPKTLHRPKGSFTNPQGIYLVEKRTLQNAKSFFLLLRDGKDTIRK